MHSPEHDGLILLADSGELDPAALARLAAHEPGCPECAALRAGLGAGRAAADRAAVSWPEGRLEALAGRVVGADAGAGPAPRPAWVPRLLAAAALGAAFFLLPRREGGPAPTAAALDRDLARLDRELAAAERAWPSDEPGIDDSLRGLQESAARLEREVGGADGRP